MTLLLFTMGSMTYVGQHLQELRASRLRGPDLPVFTSVKELILFQQLSTSHVPSTGPEHDYLEDHTGP